MLPEDVFFSVLIPTAFLCCLTAVVPFAGCASCKKKKKKVDNDAAAPPSSKAISSQAAVTSATTATDIERTTSPSKSPSTASTEVPNTIIDNESQNVSQQSEVVSQSQPITREDESLTAELAEPDDQPDDESATTTAKMANSPELKSVSDTTTLEPSTKIWKQKETGRKAEAIAAGIYVDGNCSAYDTFKYDFVTLKMDSTRTESPPKPRANPEDDADVETEIIGLSQLTDSNSTSTKTAISVKSKTPPKV